VRAPAVVVLAAACGLGGCAAVGDLTGAVAGFASGAATANPGIGISVGIVVRSATNELLDRVTRVRKENEHDAIAAAAAQMNAGETRPWSIDQRLVGDSQGEVRVLRVIQTPLALCKELLFSVTDEKRGDLRRAWFTTTACEREGGWKWATAEPAVERWLNLQ
jgi:hypothetical protein